MQLHLWCFFCFTAGMLTTLGIAFTKLWYLPIFIGVGVIFFSGVIIKATCNNGTEPTKSN